MGPAGISPDLHTLTLHAALPIYAVADRVRSARPSPPQPTIEPRLPAALRLSTSRTGTNWPALARQPDCQGTKLGVGGVKDNQRTGDRQKCKEIGRAHV